MAQAATAVRLGITVQRAEFLLFEAALLTSTVGLNSGPHLAAGDFGQPNVAFTAEAGLRVMYRLRPMTGVPHSPDCRTAKLETSEAAGSSGRPEPRWRPNPIGSVGVRVVVRRGAVREIAPTAEHSPAIFSTSTAMVTQTHRRIFTLAAGILLAVTAVTGSAAAQQDPKPPKVFWWDRDMHAGDCTMFAGAHWVLKYDGTAHFTREGHQRRRQRRVAHARTLGERKRPALGSPRRRRAATGR
ncbi:hypothetical protein [Nocardia sp. NPDC057455]|uniref:hypothetical protein n=1 Tax=Nocardia sp. NPDC057455 TaxID=3346138 RepID=UPI003670C74F